MEVEHINSVVLSLALLIAALTWASWRIINYVWFTPKKVEKWLREQGFSGNPYRLWHGDLKDIKKMTAQAYSKPISLSDDILPRVFPFHHQILHKYGKKSYFWQGPIARVLIMDPEMLREILYKYSIFQKPISGSPIFRLLVAGIVSQEGERWVKHRTLLNPAFKLHNLKQMLPAVHACCSNMVRKLENWVKEKGAVEMDLWPHLGSLSADVISRTAFGSSYEEGKRIFQLQTEQAKLAFGYTQSIYIPGWRFLPTKTNRRMLQIYKEVRGLMLGIINKRIKAMRVGEAENDDLLGILMDSNFKAIRTGRRNNVGLTIDEVVEECKLFYFAGQETTTNLLAFTIVMLCKHQDWQARARQEVFQVFGNIIEPDFERLNHLKIVTMILYEVLRLYPPATMLLRKTVGKTELRGVTMPNGLELMLPMIFVHHDTDLWGDDAKEFKPSRFSEGIEKATKGHASFFPFSSGPRVCIGQHLAMTEAKLAIAMILHHFSLDLSPSYVHAPFSLLSLQPQYGVNVILTKV
ncbi:cytochrome P450 CYP72A219-like [Ipomoea triloba]|uniref:cytochrome P450 CYP72A219-like n=1 Tax=Ipomoea triloba TaxID=35885 RepID=UPI00125D409E|nr:cytochrome P450 CYP72A219-like [Ipomoea triloba]